VPTVQGMTLACIRVNVIAIRCIHCSAWSRNSANFAFWAFSEVERRVFGGCPISGVVGRSPCIVDKR
jgi:hypothetical protein